MVQIKKAEVRAAILEAAYDLFEKKNYASTSIAEIGRAAGVVPSAIYIYFKSKLDLFYSVYEPWIKNQLLALEREVAHTSGHRAKVRRIVEAIWIDIPRESNCFANNMIQAGSLAKQSDNYSGDLLEWCETKVAEMLVAALPECVQLRTNPTHLAYIIFMAFDGFAISAYLDVRSDKTEHAVDTMTDIILGEVPARPGFPAVV